MPANHFCLCKLWCKQFCPNQCPSTGLQKSPVTVTGAGLLLFCWHMGPTDYLAIYGAGLSTAVAAWNYARSRSKVRVVLIFSVETVGEDTQAGASIFIQNPSAQTVHITNVSLLYPFKNITIKERIEHMVRFRRLPIRIGWCHSDLSLHGVDDGCPISVEPGKSHKIFIRDEVLENLLKEAKSRQLKAVAQDALWRNKYSNVFEYPAVQGDDVQTTVDEVGEAPTS